MKKAFIYFICFVFNFSLAAQKNYYVKQGGTQSGGSSWRVPSGDLQVTIDKAAAGDNIYVAVGTYYGGFIMKEGVQVKGGYTANINNPTERYSLTETDPAKQSILDGGGIQRVLTQYAPFSKPTIWEGFVVQNGFTSFEFKKGDVIYSSSGDKEAIGILYKYDSASGQGMMFGIKEIQKQWGGYGTELTELSTSADQESVRNDNSGFVNSGIILRALGDQSIDFSTEDYSLNGNYAAYWCDTITTGGYTGWYLPSGSDLQEVYDANINTIMRNWGKALDYGYWTGSQVENTLAWTYYFGDGNFHPSLKYVSHTVSAVCPFTASGQLPDSTSTFGGGVLLRGNGILKDCIVTNNQSPSKGGGVYVGVNGKLDNCTVNGNDAPEGKEIYYESYTGLISSTNEPNGFNIYPNPVKAGEQITVVSNTNQPMSVHYRFINSSGATVKEGTTDSTSKFSLPTPLQKGIYLLQLDLKNYSVKIIVN
jgi:hypothetical protein